MRRSLTKLAVPLVTILALLVAVAWMAGAFKQKVQPGTGLPDTVTPAQTVAVLKREQLVYEPVPASIEAKQSTIISSRILARIERVHVRAGDVVQQGQLLIELEKTDLKSKVSQAQAARRSVLANLKEAKTTLARVTSLVEKKALAQADLDKAQANHDTLVANLANINQTINEAETALGFADIKAPISGRIVDRFAEPGDTAQPGVKLLSLYNPASLWVEANVREQLALSLNIGQPLAVSIPALKATRLSEIEEMVPAGNVSSRSFLVKSRLLDSQGLLPGMYARLDVPAGQQAQLLIPQAYLAKIGQLDIAWVMHEGALERRFIRIGKAYPDGMVEVISGLQEGDLVAPAGE